MAAEQDEPALRAYLMTEAQRLRQQGYAQGAAEGYSQGEARGEARGKAGMLLKQMRLKFTTVPDWAVDRVEGATAEQLDRWAERILTASTVDEVVAD